ncbi:MAG: hypothetical protein P4L44_05400 [Oryzomonas sp.]|uniref:hypothetical protein n=1 Tax=Oryzomonas sp. TaxID=2855186 RepID=UPI00283FC677|nr:hypothetical protein [Oryzomonas sp.]MDR3579374.1 hypothetical protein [Oryzomonas sp.]
MSFKKRILAVAAAGALGALAAVPAMAFENEFHGTYTLKYYLTNYEQPTPGLINPGSINTLPGNSSKYAPAYDSTQNLRTQNYFEQRARIFYTAKASDDLKLVTGFEIDSDWGDKAQGSLPDAGGSASQFSTAAFRNSGGALEADAVNLETKWVYLDFKIPSTPTRVSAGIQAFKDSLKGIFFDFDAGGVMTTTKMGNTTVNLGYIRGYDQSFFAVGSNSLPKGNENLDIGVVEAKVAVTKDINVGASYYLYSDGRPVSYGGSLGSATVAPTTGSSSTYGTAASPGGVITDATVINTFGLNADAKVGLLNLSGFVAYQGGEIKGINTNGIHNAYLNAFAYNLAAKAAVGPGTLRSAMLFTSGNDNKASNLKSAHLTGWVGTNQSPDAVWTGTPGTNSYNEGNMMLLNRNLVNNNTNTDYAIVYNSGNGTTPVNSQGLYLYTIGYDATITPKLYTNVNAGFAWAAHTNSLKPIDANTKAANASNFLGTELNIETGYKMYDNLTARVQAAYVILGGYYANAISVGGQGHDPENPYTARIILSYAF